MQILGKTIAVLGRAQKATVKYYYRIVPLFLTFYLLNYNGRTQIEHKFAKWQKIFIILTSLWFFLDSPLVWKTAGITTIDSCKYKNLNFIDSALNIQNTHEKLYDM